MVCLYQLIYICFHSLVLSRFSFCYMFLFEIISVHSLFTSFIIMFLFSCIVFEVCFCRGESLLCTVFFFLNFKLIFQDFSNKIFNSLLLSSSRNNFYLYFTGEVCVFFVIEFLPQSKFLRPLFNSPWLLYELEQSFRPSFYKSIWCLSNLYVDRLIILRFMLLVLFGMLVSFRFVLPKNGFLFIIISRLI